MHSFQHLKIAAIDKITAESVNLTFEIPEEAKKDFNFVPGQYITIKAQINGEELRRSYSIASDRADAQISVGIKKVSDGLFSRYANEELKAGTQLEVHPPEGRFTYDPATDKAETVVAFAAGSGITPIMSIMKEVLHRTENDFILVYGNRTLADTMYHKEISDLIRQYPERLHTQFIYSREKDEDALFGRIERSTVNYILNKKVDRPGSCLFYLCGPEEMINNVADALNKEGVSKERIKFELFTASEDTAENTTDIPAGKARVKVLVDDEEFTLVMDKKQRVLDAVLDEDIDAPYSCQGGICSSCIARITEGEASMVKNQILTESEVAEGLILTCQAHAVSDTLALDYDDV